MNERYADRLCGAIDDSGTPACVGIDPVLERLPAGVEGASDLDRLRNFCLGVVEAVAGVVPAVKPQSACYERFGWSGVAVLEDVCRRARDLGLLVVLDVKRGDIGSTAEHYAAAAVGMGVDAVTVNGYMGRSAIDPFVEAGLGVYVLVRTSNPDSDELQAEPLASGGTVAERMASIVDAIGWPTVGARGLSAVGAVVGATKAGGEVAALRSAMPDAPVLVPGVGAQGGTIEQVRPLVRSGAGSMGEAGVLINASRSVLYPAETGADWRAGVRAAASGFARDCAGVWSPGAG
jgi:orotidine-5'-phosphate decarboxylase